MARILVVSDAHPGGQTFMDQEVRPFQMGDECASLQIIERLASAVCDSEIAKHTADLDAWGRRNGLLAAIT